MRHTTHTTLKNAIENDKLVVFVGSGTSIKFGFPNWKDLVIEIIQDLEQNDPTLKDLIPIINSGLFTPIKALSVLKERKLQKEVLEKICNIFRLDDTKDYSIHKKITSLSNKIVTTNYDKAFEFSNPLQTNVILPQSSYKLSTLSSSIDYVFKIHGDIDYPENCILFEDQYENVYKSGSSAYLLELQKILTSNTLLFIGFSLKDPYIEDLLNDISQLYGGYNNKHFIITTDADTDKFINQGIIPIQLDSYNDLDQTLDDLCQIKMERKVSVDNNLYSTYSDPTLSELAEVFSIETNKLSQNSRSVKKDFENVYRVRKELFNKMISEFDQKLQLSPELKSHFRNSVFDDIVLNEFLQSHILVDIESIRDISKYSWYDRSVIVSALTLSLLSYKKFDIKKANLLLDFVSDFEDGVWEQALSGLILSLILHVNKWQKYSEFVRRLTTLQNVEKIQNGIDTIEFILRTQMYKQSLFHPKIFELSFFQERLENYFLPFYRDNSVMEEFRNNAPNTFDVEDFQNWLLNEPTSSALKYYICLTKDFYEVRNENEIPIHARFSLYNKLGIASTLRPFFTIISDYYNFINHYPKQLVNNFFDSHFSLASTAKLKSIILNTRMQLKVTADSFMQNDEYKHAIPIYLKALKLEPDNIVVLWNIAQCYEAIKEYHDAIFYRRKISTISPDDIDNLFEIADNLNSLKRFNDALEILLEIKEKKPEWIKNICSLISCYNNIDNIEEAFNLLSEVENRTSYSLDDHIDLGYMYAELDLHENAIFHRLKAVELSPKSQPTHHLMVVDYLYLGDFENAEKQYKLGCEINNEENIAKIEAEGMLNLFLYKNLEKAKRILGKKSFKESFAVMCNLGHIEYFKGNKEKALGYYQKSIAGFKTPRHFLYKFSKEKIIFNRYGVDAKEFEELHQSLIDFAVQKGYTSSIKIASMKKIKFYK